MPDKSPSKAPFVEKVVDDAAAPPRIRMLTGYVGSSSEKDCLRLYNDPELSEYLEIPASAVRHSEAADGDSLGATHLWVDRDADIIHRGENTVERRGRFLEGSVTPTATAQPQAGIPQPGIPQADAPQLRPNPSLIDGCRSAFQACDLPRTFVLGDCGGGNSIFTCPPSRFDICQSFVDACPTRFACPTQFGCPSIDCPTQPTGGCPPTFGPNCPPSVFTICQSRPLQCQTPVTRVVQCPSQIACPTEFVNCQSAVDACPSVQQVCVTQQANCASEFQLCQGVTRIAACQSEIDVCASQVCDLPVTRNNAACGGGVAVQPSFVDGCASSLGCTAAACNDAGLAGGFRNPGRFGMRPRFRGF